jgi:hypothetical protein
MRYKIDASVLGGKKSDKNSRYRLKVSVHDLGLHIMGIIVQDSIIEGEKYYVTTPAHKVGAKFYKDVTFETSNELWLQIQAACIKAISGHEDSPSDQLERLWK